MECYIYQIINQITNERYVGQTTNFSRRRKNHLSSLRNNQLKTNKNYFIQSKIFYNGLSDEEIREKAEWAYNEYHI